MEIVGATTTHVYACNHLYVLIVSDCLERTKCPSQNDSTRKQTSQWNNQGNFSVFYIHTGLTMKVSPRPPHLHRDHTATPPEGCLGHGLLLFHLGPGCLDGVIGAKTGPICCLTPHVACIVLLCFIYLPFSVIQPFEM